MLKKILFFIFVFVITLAISQTAYAKTSNNEKGGKEVRHYWDNQSEGNWHDDGDEDAWQDEEGDEEEDGDKDWDKDDQDGWFKGWHKKWDKWGKGGHKDDRHKDGEDKDDKGGNGEEENDVCPNIDGVQTQVPDDYFIHDKTKECIKFTHGGPDEDKDKGEEVEPQVLGEVTTLPQGGGDWLLYQSLAATLGLLIATALIGRFLPKSR